MNRLCAVLVLAAQLLLACAREGDENLGLGETPPPQAVERRQLGRIQGLVQVATVPVAEAVRRLGSHRLEVHTKWYIVPPERPGVDVQPVAMKEESLIESDGRGGLHVLHNNDHGLGSEAVLVDGVLYVRMRYAPYLRRRPEGDEVARLLAAAGDTAGALIQALAAWIKIDAVEQAQVAGRPAFKLTLSRQPSAQKDLRMMQAALPPAKLWRKAISVQSLEGAAVVDAQQGVLLGLRLAASFQAPRGEGGPPVRIEVSHRSTVRSLGEPVTVQAPSESMEAVRPRPMVDWHELLDGLVPGDPR
ncbi:MAG: hypothetical protein RMK29_06665 [Myxococcales bacterium]|nr:hypothetical protein [Myxococcota bacterium]MDW8281376.1 hypothetical protein [Myxococcales bacterium]